MRNLLKYSRFFNLYQNLIGSKAFNKRLTNNFIRPNANDYILDLGCGTGNIIPFLPKGISYTGIDYSNNYIKYASKKYSKYHFIQADLTKPVKLNDNYDIVICASLLSCMNDAEVKILLSSILEHSKTQTRIIFTDMNYAKDNTPMQKFLLSKERGTNLRGKEEYIKLLSTSLSIEKITIMNDAYKIPYSKIIIECMHY